VNLPHALQQAFPAWPKSARPTQRYRVADDDSPGRGCVHIPREPNDRVKRALMRVLVGEALSHRGPLHEVPLLATDVRSRSIPSACRHRPSGAGSVARPENSEPRSKHAAPVEQVAAGVAVEGTMAGVMMYRWRDADAATSRNAFDRIQDEAPPNGADGRWRTRTR
jgi:hypothetical protein